MTELLQFLAEKGFIFAPMYDGTIQRFAIEGNETRGWFIGREFQLGEKTVLVATVGDWKTGAKHHFQTAGNFTPEEKAKLSEQSKELQRLEQEALKKLHDETALYCAAKWENLPDRGQSPYLELKGLPNNLYGCKLESRPHEVSTVVPVRDIDGKLWGLQYIPAQKGGRKIFHPGTKKRGSFHTFQALREKEDLIYVCEGLATACSVYEATERKFPVITAFDAGNLTPVGRVLRERYPTGKLVFCADNDRQAAGVNRGLEAAYQAASAASGEVRWPRFKNPDSPGTDWNDLHAEEGLEEVSRQLSAAPVADMPETEKPEKKPEKKKRISEKQIADWLLDKLSPNIIRQDKSLFMYDGKKWNELFDADIDKLKNDLNAMVGNQLGNKEVEGIYKTFLRYVPHVPRGMNLFTPNPACANFQDGTLHLRRDLRTGVYSTEFLPHRREDYLCWVVPFRYQTDRTIENKLLLTLIHDAFEGDPDREAKIVSLQEMGGAMLVPAFAQMFFLHGVSGSRKSTIAKTLLKAVSFENISWLDPGSMEGFMLEGMVGKLLNANTDIDDFEALPRNFLKRFEDGLPFPVNRKNKPVAQMRLPYVHVYCANRLPSNFEGVSRALERRITLIEFHRDLTNDNRAGEIKYYEDIVFNHCPEGVYNFMLRGLERLIANGGKFTPPGSGLAKLREWQSLHDPISLFLEAVGEGEVGNQNARFSTDKNSETLRVERGALAKEFFEWCRVSGVNAKRIHSKILYAGLRARGFSDRKIRGVRYFYGIGCPERASGAGEPGVNF